MPRRARERPPRAGTPRAATAGEEATTMGKAHPPEVLARNVFTIVTVGIMCQILVIFLFVLMR
jgi:hypothetical protein